MKSMRKHKKEMRIRESVWFPARRLTQWENENNYKRIKRYTEKAGIFIIALVCASAVLCLGIQPEEENMLPGSEWAEGAGNDLLYDSG